jgi:transposase
MRWAVARRAQAQWARLVAEWKRSGLTARQFASRRKIEPKTLSWWAWRLRGVGAQQPRRDEPGERVELVSVAVDGREADRLGWELSLPGGAVLRVDGPLETASLREVLAAFRRKRRR